MNQQHMNQMDLLTGLPNITYFRSLSQKILDDSAERSKGLVFIYFDIKNFRAYNYYYGFDAGDRYLVKVGNIISQTFPELYVSRFSDDHFLLVAYNHDIEKRLQSVHDQTLIKQMNKSVSIKAGIYVVPPSGEMNAVLAYDNAKLACENIKQQASVFNCYYNEELGRREKLRQYIIENVDTAIENEYIKVYYQPIVHVISRRLCGYEGLARWIDPEFGFLSPADFITTLENARLIHRLDTYMIHKICKDMRVFKDNGWTVVPVSVNLSTLDFQMTDMPIIASQAIVENDLPNDFLNIEITESAFSTDQKGVRDVLKEFRKNGFEIWMDNFGSKYSSLNILEEVAVDLLKVDMRFLKTFHTSPKSRIILKNIMHMAKELGIRTLMEGVEDEEVMEFLRQTGCEQAQGYLFGKPAQITEEAHLALKPETKIARNYYNEIGSVNLLSQTPLNSIIHEELKTVNKSAALSPYDYNNFDAQNNIHRYIHSSNTQDSDANVSLTTIPLAIAEFDGKKVHFLMSNPSFRNIIALLGVDGKNTPDDVFNNNRRRFGINAHYIAQQAIQTGEEIVHDFVTSEGFNNLRLRCIAYNFATNTGALLIVIDQITGNAVFKRKNRQESALKFLYSLYSRVDLIKLDGTSIENVYLNSSRYRETLIKDSVEISIKNFAERNIYIEDQQKFIDFYILDTLEERINEAGVDHIIEYFRTRDESRNYSWQMYMLLPIIISGEKYLLSCARGIDAERMRRLPDIDRMGTEYYDMPGNPIFLLLASRAFTSTLGYGSFEQFLNNSFYIEANLTASSVLYMHLGKQGIVSSQNYNSVDYDEVIRDMIINTVIDDNHNEVAKFFKRSKLLEEYHKGKVVGEMEYLRRPEPDSKPRYLHTAYQLRESNETGDIHAFFLSFDIDAYRRTNESMTELIERDNLTGLYNRGTAVSMIRNYLDAAEGRRAALVILDLDNFKQINDRFGHDCGDEIIKDAAFRMKYTFKKHGLIARIGGDEYLAFLRDISTDEVDKILNDFSKSHKSINYYGQHISYTMSIGYAIYPDHGVEYQHLYQNADMALYSVKMSGRANYNLFSPLMENINRNQLGFSISQISEGMPGGFLIYRDNESQEILYANRRLMEIYECDSLEEFRDFTGNSFRGCVLSEDWEIVQSTINEQLHVSSGYDYVQYRARTAKGRIRMIEDFGRLVHSPDDGDIFYVFIIDLEDKGKIYNNLIRNHQNK